MMKITIISNNTRKRSYTNKRKYCLKKKKDDQEPKALHIQLYLRGELSRARRQAHTHQQSGGYEREARILHAAVREGRRED